MCRLFQEVSQHPSELLYARATVLEEYVHYIRTAFCAVQILSRITITK